MASRDNSALCWRFTNTYISASEASISPATRRDRAVMATRPSLNTTTRRTIVPANISASSMRRFMDAPPRRRR